MSQPTSFDKYFKIGMVSSLALFGFDGEDLYILVVEKAEDPFKGALILPSRWVKPDESNDEAINLLLEKELFVSPSQTYVEQLKAFAKLFRNPIGRVVNVAYYAAIKLDDDLKQRHDDKAFKWVPYQQVPELAFDHNEIVEYAQERLKRRVKRRPVGFHLLPEEFTIAQLQTLYERALNREMDKRNFRKKIFNSNLIFETGNTTDPQVHKKVAKLYSFDQEAYEKLSLKGYDFLF